jgi:hypothetical protein
MGQEHAQLVARPWHATCFAVKTDQWFLCPLLLYWISYVSLTAHRGRMQDDPLVFATTDHTSRILGLLVLATTIAAL